MPHSYERNGYHSPHSSEGRHSRDRNIPRQRHSQRSSRSRDDKIPNWSWVPTIISFISMTLFASWCGIVALYCSGLSYSDHKAGDYARARYKRWWVYLCAITGIIFTVVCIVFLLLVMYVFKVPEPKFQDSEYWLPLWLQRELKDDTTA